MDSLPVTNLEGTIMTKSEISALNSMRVQGKSAGDIALTLHLSVNTVRSYIRRHPLPGSQQVLCRNCEKPMLRNPHRKIKLFCSDKCRNAWWNAHPELVKRKAYYHLRCRHCGKEFVSYGNSKRKYCSRKCYDDSRKTDTLSDTDGIDEDTC